MGRMKKVITWRLLSTVLCLLIGRVWFGDWHTSWFGLFLAVLMTVIHFYFEKVWRYYE
tara:strand:- start:2022 stop:2195 length:174 start_codon:yes stop_codon:yes gene_type:complete